MNRRIRPTRSSFDPALGLELEMVVVHTTTGRSLPVRHYFESLNQRLQARMPADVLTPVLLEGRCVALSCPEAEYGLDNGFNLLETSTRPVRRSEGGLAALAELVDLGLEDVLAALRADEAGVLNASQHPDCTRDPAWYRQVCVPRPIYRELVGYRGWKHWEGIDAKAQNGANVQVPVADAVRALNVMIGLAAAHVALFANSPLESGLYTGLKENRLTVWPRVFDGSRFAGDAMLTRYPPRPFTDLGDYFRWMFRPGTVSRSLPLARRHDYKSAPTVLLDGDPSLSAFLVSGGWEGRRTDNGERVRLTPDAAHFEHSQIAQFMDARLRYRLASLPALPELMSAWRSVGELEALFQAHGAEIYIEGRGPGAGFADQVLLDEAGPAVAAAMVMSPIALQWGLLQRLDEAEALMACRGWGCLGELRERALRYGMEDPQVRELCAEVMAIAESGLQTEEQPFLEYARYVLAEGRSAADRLLDSWHALSDGEPALRLAQVTRRHMALPPSAWGGVGCYS